MAAVWRASLPQKPSANGFIEHPPNLLVRSPMDTGPAKVRRRDTAGVTTMTAPFRMTLVQLAEFRDMLHNDLQDEVLPYTWAHPITGVSGSYRIVEPPAYEPIAGGLAWRVTLSLELLP